VRFAREHGYRVDEFLEIIQDVAQPSGVSR